MIAPHLGCETRRATLACAARCELRRSSEEMCTRGVVCTERRNKRSQMGSFRDKSHLHTCARRCLLSGLHRITQLFAPTRYNSGMHYSRDADNRRTRPVVHHTRDEGEQLLSFSITLYYGSADARFIFQSSRNCPLGLFSSTLGERETKSKKERAGGRKR